MGNKRIEFTQKIKNLLCVSVSGHCSICGDCTTWVDKSIEEKQNIGEAAHIEAASEGGPRYNPNQSDEQRASFDNGIWVCSNCHTKIDSNVDYYTVSRLYCYKSKAIKRAQMNLDISLKGNGGIEVADFTRAMISFFSQLYGIRESLHKSISEVKKYVDGNFSEVTSENMFYSEYCIGMPYISNNISVIRGDLWRDKLPPLCKIIREGRLYISDKSYDLEQQYLKIIGNCPYIDSEWWNFFIRIKEHFKELDEMNTQLLNEYKTQYELFHEDV